MSNPDSDSDLLGKAVLVIQIYDDGASPRRGSLIALGRSTITASQIPEASRVTGGGGGGGGGGGIIMPS